MWAFRHPTSSTPWPVSWYRAELDSLPTRATATLGVDSLRPMSSPLRFQTTVREFQPTPRSLLECRYRPPMCSSVVNLDVTLPSATAECGTTATVHDCCQEVFVRPGPPLPPSLMSTIPIQQRVQRTRSSVLCFPPAWIASVFFSVLPLLCTITLFGCCCPLSSYIWYSINRSLKQFSLSFSFHNASYFDLLSRCTLYCRCHGSQRCAGWVAQHGS